MLHVTCCCKHNHKSPQYTGRQTQQLLQLAYQARADGDKHTTHDLIHAKLTCQIIAVKASGATQLCCMPNSSSCNTTAIIQPHLVVELALANQVPSQKKQAA
jgi:hypothetical protein